MCSHNFFDITNCGISFNADASHFAIADFGGNLYIFSADDQSLIPNPITRALIGIPIRTLVWCHDTGHIIAGCVGGYLFKWDGQSE